MHTRWSQTTKKQKIRRKLKIMNHRERNNRENNRKNQIEKLIETSEENAANETDKS
jgi:hypothetical protein